MRIDRVKLIAEMAQQDITSIRLAEMAGVSRVTVSAVRCGKACAPVTARKIAAALGVPVDSIIKKEVNHA
ncbi:helix-turn-helix transcriptional regulator [uncultured Gemmiger sp.]|uniref:helix-turn-helix domain-containing protein n=1 Tax=uncultured Gemmiger sp. TaxID=1623490 RepID=UPI0025E263E6|nr:helix-turn-helix transcriptional regulator [uncultured Gemmiger sp.]